MDNEFKNEVREKFAEIDNRFDKVENRLDKVENRLDKIEYRLDNIESILLSLKRSMLIMEDYMKNNIPALFDGYSLIKISTMNSSKKLPVLKKIQIQIH